MINPDIFPEEAMWCRHHQQFPGMPGYTLFYRRFVLDTPQIMKIAVSADCRYRLFCDGNTLGTGPCRSDIQHYCYEEYCLELDAGEHILALDVLVWNGNWRSSAAPWSEMHLGGGVLVCGFAGNVRLDMPENWLCRIDNSRRSLEWHEAWNRSTITPVPPMDEVDFNKYDFNWHKNPGNDSSWSVPMIIGRADFFGKCDNDSQTIWRLMPRPVKQVKEKFTELSSIVSGKEYFKLQNGRLLGSVPAGKYRVIVDIGRNQTSMIHISGKGGSGVCRCAYSETLFENGLRNHSTPPHGTIGEYGYADRLILPEGKRWEYHSFHFRTGRFVELELDIYEDMVLEFLQLSFVTYPFDHFLDFRSPGNPLLENIYHVAWHTARCCIHEHYEDCPYYEQMQYIGDTRIQALISYAVTGEDAPGRQALRHFDWSRMYTGLTQSRYPCNFPQVIPLFSLIWIMMIHDHYRYFGDREVIKEHLPGMFAVLDYFERKRETNGLIGETGEWNFVDWTGFWPGGKSNRGEGGAETILNLFFAESCRMSAELLRIIGESDRSDIWEQRRRKILSAVNTYCFDRKKKRYLDVPGKPYLSVHAQIAAVLADAVPQEEQRDFLASVIDDRELVRGSLYFDFYLLEALKKCGDSENFIRMLEPWKKMLDMGYTTFPEVPYGKTRSECHAWSSGPAYEFVTGLLGIFPERPGINGIDRKLSVPESWQISGIMRKLN